LYAVLEVQALLLHESEAGGLFVVALCCKHMGMMQLKLLLHSSFMAGYMLPVALEFGHCLLWLPDALALFPQGAGTDSQVFVELSGTSGSSGEVQLQYEEDPDQKPFQRGSVDAFQVCTKLEQLSCIAIMVLLSTSFLPA
jgi:hypothetical protein